MKRLFTVLICLLAPLFTQAESSENTPNQTDQWQLVGEARLKVLFMPIYEARLHTLDGDYQQDELPARLEIQYLRDIKAKHLVKHTDKEWQRLGVDKKKVASWLPQLSEIWSDVTSNDTITLEVNHQGHSRFFHNNVFIGELNDPEFSQAFLDIWLAPNSGQKENQLRLTGKQPSNQS